MCATCRPPLALLLSSLALFKKYCRHAPLSPYCPPSKPVDISKLTIFHLEETEHRRIVTLVQVDLCKSWTLHSRPEPAPETAECVRQETLAKETHLFAPTEYYRAQHSSCVAETLCARNTSTYFPTTASPRVHRKPQVGRKGVNNRAGEKLVCP